MIEFTQCTSCKHYKYIKEIDKDVCPAFPDGIPEDVMWGEIKHDHPLFENDVFKFEE